MCPDENGLTTNPSIFVRLKQSDPAPREIAWEEFRRRYAPVIAGFARRLGAREQDIDDLIQDVMVGFYAKSPTFVYDPAKGRFRGYLKVCTCRALGTRARRRSGRKQVSLAKLDPEDVETEQAWNDVWEKEKLRRALDRIRDELGESRTYRAFELHVVENRPAQEVANELKLHVNSVYRARDHVLEVLRGRLLMDDDE